MIRSIALASALVLSLGSAAYADMPEVGNSAAATGSAFAYSGPVTQDRAGIAGRGNSASAVGSPFAAQERTTLNTAGATPLVLGDSASAG